MNDSDKEACEKIICRTRGLGKPAARKLIDSMSDEAIAELISSDAGIESDDKRFRITEEFPPISEILEVNDTPGE